MTHKAIILDLDDTIFRTKSMDGKVFQPFFNHLSSNLKPSFGEDTIEQIISDLWEQTWDKVISKYDIPLEIIVDSTKILDSLELPLEISPYPDYSFLKNLPIPKYLVTTSLTSLQKAKISALKIDNDFEKIIINDTFRESKTKLDIFRELLAEFGLVPECTYVIGDNADSEIRAGNELNMVTIQILREGVVKGDNAKHHIRSFDELGPIINQYNFQ